MVYTGWCQQQTCKTLLLQMSHLKSFSAENIFFLLFCVVSFFLFATHVAFQMFTKKVFQVERHSEIFLFINLCDAILWQDFRVYSTDNK